MKKLIGFTIIIICICFVISCSHMEKKFFEEFPSADHITSMKSEVLVGKNGRFWEIVVCYDEALSNLCVVGKGDSLEDAIKKARIDIINNEIE